MPVLPDRFKFSFTDRLHHFHDAIHVALGVLIIWQIPVVYLIGSGHGYFGELGMTDIAH